MTLADRLIFTRNRPAGFDWMRIVLASSIVIWHSVITSYGGAAQTNIWNNSLFRPPLAALLAMFFALSGFLVSGSLERCRTMVSFAGLRVMRIFPALVVETLLSAFILGPLLTNLDLPHYLAGPELRAYLLNMLGLVHFYLPGLFSGNPVPSVVNLQLWTVPFELRCYVALILVSLFGIYARRWLLLAAVIALTAVVGMTLSDSQTDHPEALSGNQLVLCFLWGVVLFRFRAAVAWNGWLGLLCAVAACGLFSTPKGDVFAPIPIAYLTVYLGLLNPPRVPLLFSGDYSYGLFLYGFPVEQAIASAGPWAQHWYVVVGLGFPLTAVIAVSSWWLIEKPVLAQKGALLWLENKAMAAAHAGRTWWGQRAAGRGAPFDRSSVGPAKSHEIQP